MQMAFCFPHTKYNAPGKCLLSAAFLTWLKIGRGKERERERLKAVEKANYFHVLGKCFLAAEESSIYNRVQVLRQVIGGSRVNLWQMLLSPRIFFFLIQLRRLHLH